MTEQRVQVSAMRVRIPDVCLIARDDYDEITQRPPMLCVQVLSPDDRFSRVQTKVADYIAFGVPTVWIIDPYEQRAWIATAAGTIAVADGILRCMNPDLEVALSEVLPEE